MKTVFLKLLQNALENTWAEVSFFRKLYLKKRISQMFSCKFWKVFKNTYFVEHMRTAVFLMSHQVEKIILNCRTTTSWILSSKEEALPTSWYKVVKIQVYFCLYVTDFMEGLHLTFKNNTKTSKKERFFIILRLIIT